MDVTSLLPVSHLLLPRNASCYTSRFQQNSLPSSSLCLFRRRSLSHQLDKILIIQTPFLITRDTTWHQGIYQHIHKKTCQGENRNRKKKKRKRRKMKNWLSVYVNRDTSHSRANQKTRKGNNQVTSSCSHKGSGKVCAKRTEETDGRVSRANHRDKEVKLDQVNDAVLVSVFKYLPLQNRISVQRVNKRWNGLIQDLWLSQRALSFGFYPGK